jgi:hypothetical protein
VANLDADTKRTQHQGGSDLEREAFMRAHLGPNQETFAGAALNRRPKISPRT